MADRVDEHAEFENTVAAYALGAAEPDEVEAVLAHLDACASCRELAQRLGRAVAAIPIATEHVQPPPRLRARILAAASSTAAEPIAARQPRRRRFAVPRLITRPERQRFGWPAAAVATLAVAILGLAAWNVTLTRQLDSQRNDVAQFHASGGAGLSASSANVVALQRERLMLVDFRGLPPVERDKVYELWLQTPAGKMIPAGAFQPDPDGSKILVLSRDVRNYTALAVTVEAGPNGVSAPTQAPQLLAHLS